MKGCNPLSIDDIEALKKELSPRNRVIFVMGIRTGFRISELLSLDIKDVLNDDNSIKEDVRVKKSKMKGKKEGRVIPLHNEVKELLKIYLQECPGKMDEALFRSRWNTRLDRISFWESLKLACKRAGVPSERIATHSMRKTFATNMNTIFHGDIYMLKEAMGHSSIDSTAKYIQPNKDLIWNAIKNAK